MSVAQVVIVGRVGRDPERKGEHSPAKFSVATDRKVKGEKITDWHDVIAFGKQADFVMQYISKGREVAVTGRLTVESWEAKDGSGKRSKHVIVADTVQGVGGKGDARDGDRPGFSRAPEPYDAGDGHDSRTVNGGVDVDDIPF
jgi:single-strand DNA-binding protein